MNSKKTSRLSGIDTAWAIVLDAYSGDGPIVVPAQQRLLMHFTARCGAICERSFEMPTWPMS